MIKEYSPVLVSLLKGVVYDTNEEVWELLLKHEPDVKKYFSEIYQELFVDKAEGYAFLKQMISNDSEIEFPKLISKRQLSFHTSLICLLLRKHLIENDNEGTSARAILSKETMYTMARPFLKTTTDEVKQQKHLDTAITKICEEGFLRRLKSEEELYEINRIIKAFVNADVVQVTLDKFKNHNESGEDV